MKRESLMGREERHRPSFSLSCGISKETRRQNGVPEQSRKHTDYGIGFFNKYMFKLLLAKDVGFAVFPSCVMTVKCHPTVPCCYCCRLASSVAKAKHERLNKKRPPLGEHV